MNKIVLFSLLLLFSASVVSAQTITPALTSPSYQTADGINYVYTIAMTDSTGTTYSPPLNVAGYIPQNLTSNPISFYLVATGTKDSIKAIVQGRMKKSNTTWSTWGPIDTVSVTYNSVTGIVSHYSLNLNSQHPDQIRFQIIGASSVNRANVVCTAIAVLKKQYGIFEVR